MLSVIAIKSNSIHAYNKSTIHELMTVNIAPWSYAYWVSKGVKGSARQGWVLG